MNNLIGKKVVLRRTVPDKIIGGKWINRIEEFEVIVMAIVDGYAMVKRPRCVPFVERAKDLVISEKETPQSG